MYLHIVLSDYVAVALLMVTMVFLLSCITGVFDMGFRLGLTVRVNSEVSRPVR